ncbi:insulinase family protein [Chitinophaga pendula]|uniref:M16 family metallopeptidase n=1 Tax=Chitinophaga TaxID=79328 RepID=UPI000BAEBBBE|nr:MULTISPECIES: M16 family metallopeptidase [Chitinophaga]ASZ09647.1 peptidase M16 [Chitinophaga sp. MD30]UCJ07421.1 insulinase family protein [Chitinophaga pendula]
MHYRHWATAGLLFLSAGIQAAKAQQQNQLIPLDTAVRTGKLPNGFTYYIRKNTEPSKRALFYLVNKVGSILEDDDQLGLAHFMEHMNFNGTHHFPKNELIDYLQKVGVRFGADLNAYTSYDETVYQLPIPTDNPALVSRGLDIMRDWAQGALLETDDINKERGVILEEKRLREGVGKRLQDKTMPVVMNNSRYTYRLPIGTDSILINFPAETIRRFYRDWYRPNLQALIVVGDIDVNQVEKQILKQFADLKNPSKERPRPDYKIALTGKNQFLLLTDPEVTTTELEILVKHPGTEMKTTTDYLNAIKRGLFNQLLSYRLSELSQQSNPPFLGVKAGIGNLIGGLEQFTFSVSAKPGKLQEAFAIAWSQIEQVKRYGFTQAELERAKTAHMKGLDNAHREVSKTPSSSYVSEYQQLFLHESASPGFEWEYNFTKEVLPGITAEDIKTFANQYICETNRDIFVVAPEKEKTTLPDAGTIETWLAKVKSAPLDRYKDTTANDVLLKQLPEGGKIVSRKHIPAIGVQALTLSNGVKVWLKPTTYKNDQIQFVSFAPGGINKYSNEDYPTASNTIGIIGGSGLAGFSPVQLSKLLNGKAAAVGAYIGGRSQGINGGCSSDDLETALQLIYLRYTAPRKDTVLFENAVARSREQIRNKYDDPGNVFRDTVNNVLSNYHYRLSPITQERLDSVYLEKAFDIYKDRFADAADANFVFVGNFHTDSIAPLLERYLGALPALNRHEKPVIIHTTVPKGKLIKTVEKGQDNKATVLLVYNGDCRYSEEEGLQLEALSEILQYRLLTSLREKAGEVYTPSVQGGMTREPDQRFSVNVSFGCAPEHVEHLVGLVQEDIADLQKSGATQDELQKYKAGLRQQFDLQVESNEFWLQYIAGKVERKEALKPLPDIEKRLSKLTGNAISIAAKKYLSGENCIRFVALPEKK